MRGPAHSPGPAHRARLPERPTRSALSQHRPRPSLTRCPAGTGETPTLGTLDFYMARLHGAIERDPAQHERLIARVKEILARVARCGGGAECGECTALPRGLHHPSLSHSEHL